MAEISLPLAAPSPLLINDDFARTRYVAYSPTYWAPYAPASRLDIRADLALLRQTWNGLITYGSNGTLASIPAVAAELGFERLILGIYNIHSAEDVGNAMDLIERYPQMIRSVCIGNEGLAFKIYSVDELVRTIAEFRRRFPGLLITTSEPIFSWGEKAILDAIDYCAPIIHPWIHEIFKNDPTTAAMWTIQAAQRLQILSGKMVLIKETGFPSDGKQFPHDLQCAFWDVLLREIGAFTQNVHLAAFEAFDIPDKVNFSAMTYWDTCWGLYDRDRQPKPVTEVMRAYFQSLPGPRPERARLATTISVHEPERVGVVIAGKDRPQYMRQAIESVLEQDYPVHQLVLVNDNSSSSEVDTVCRGYLNDRRVKYVARTSRGSSGTARNAGLREITTPLVCFLDDDDAFLPGKLRAQVKAFGEEPNSVFVGTAAMVMDQDGNYCARFGNPDFFPGAPLASMLAFCRLIHSSVMMRTAVVRDLGGYQEFFQGEDWELWCRLIARGHRMAFVNRPLTLYRRHGNNISDSRYVRQAVHNVLSTHLSDSATLMRPLPYDPRSGELLKASIQIAHGWYEAALPSLQGLTQSTARIARYICWRELGEYGKASSEIESWAWRVGLAEALGARLRTHEAKFQGRRHAAVVGSPALLVEQRLLAQDALATASGAKDEPELSRYFHQNPKHINIEYDEGDGDDAIFFRRVSLTSC